MWRIVIYIRVIEIDVSTASEREWEQSKNDTLNRCVCRPSFVQIFANAGVFPIRATVRLVNAEWMMHNS